MFEDDDFFINDDELAEDNSLTIADSAKVDLLDSIIKAAQDMKANIKFNERTDADNNLHLITSYVEFLIKISEVELDELSDEEAEELISNILRSTTELTFNNINDILPEEEPEANMMSDDEDIGDSTDW